ncbi:MAG: GntR family transcriptional regulator [Alphaproteobacteria bacterium]|nr:GntR family transcriptional regulator [Alphaproteobacteria bacterium]
MAQELMRRTVYAGPLYVQIKKLLHENMLSEKWSAGTLLPNESDLARAYGVSIGTMRKALQELESAGWISRRQGRGTFVMDPRHASRRRLNHFYLNGEHFSPDSFTYLSCTLERAGSEVASGLELRKGDEVVRIRRKKLIKGILRLYEDLQVPNFVVEDLAASDERRQKVSDSDVLGYSAFIRRCTERVRPSLPDEACADVLEIEKNRPILVCDRVAYDAEMRPVEWSRRFALMESVEYCTDAQ